MAVQLEAALLCDRVLPALDIGVVELFDAPALQAYQVIVMPALAQLEHRFAGFEVLAREQARVLELGQHSVNGREPDVDAFRDQLAIDIFRGEMPHLARLEKLEDLAARKRRLETAFLQALRRHRGIITAFVLVRILFPCDAPITRLASRGLPHSARARRPRSSSLTGWISSRATTSRRK
jgi:hypothetical protein